MTSVTERSAGQDVVSNVRMLQAHTWSAIDGCLVWREVSSDDLFFTCQDSVSHRDLDWLESAQAPGSSVCLSGM